MREIKFRAWWKDTLEPIPDFMEQYSLDVLDGAEDNPFIYSQFTGIRDRKGKEVFEGDIVMVINYLNGRPWEGHVHPCEVVSVPGGWELKDHWCHESLRDSEIEVIGNIYENQKITEQPIAM